MYACDGPDIEEEASDTVEALASADTQSSHTDVAAAQTQAQKQSTNLARGKKKRQGKGKSDFGANLQKALGKRGSQ